MRTSALADIIIISYKDLSSQHQSSSSAFPSEDELTPHFNSHLVDHQP